MGVANVGHTHREVVAAVRAQAERHLHVMVYGEMIQQPQVDLAARLAGLLPPPLEVVYFLRSLERHADLRVKVELDPAGEMAVDSVVSLWAGANWLEREVYDMFGITFRGHPDLRRILMWETYAEGFPLRKDFPLRGRFSRAEQVRQALNANPEAHYSMEELSIAAAFNELPAEMRERLRRGERGKLPFDE